MAFSPRSAVKFLCLAIFANGMLLTQAGGAFASTPATVSASEFAKEQAMSPKGLVERWTPLIEEASRRFGIAETWIQAVMRMESGGRTLLDDKRPITSNAGAMGLMQVMPETYKEMQQQYGLGKNPYDPHDNVLAGTAYLSWLYGKFGYPKMFAAYNAGPGTVAGQVAAMRGLPNETRAYVSGIARILGTESPAPEPVSLIATLTRPDGTKVSIDGATVDSIRASMPDEYAPGVKTVLAMGNRRQGVVEDMATVMSLIGAHGTKA